MRLNLLNMEKSKNIFSKITKETSLWDDYLKYMIYYVESNYHNPQPFHTTITSINNLLPLEELGLDYNYKDDIGNNFIHYLYTQKGNNLILSNEVEQYILDKTHNIYELNNKGENILFTLTNYYHAGIDGEDFFKFIKKYPNFNLHHKNNFGQNLLNTCLINEVPEALLKYLIDQNLSTDHIDNNNSNLINYFFALTYNTKNINLFNMLLKEQNISLKNTHDSSIIDVWCLTIKEDQSHYSRRSEDWILHLCNQIINEEYNSLYTQDIYDNLRTHVNILDKISYSNKKLYETYNKTLKILHAHVLNQKLVTHENKAKIKI